VAPLCRALPTNVVYSCTIYFMSNKLSFNYELYYQTTEQGPNGLPELGESSGKISFL